MIEPFPWSSLPRLARVDVAIARAIRRDGGRIANELARALSALTGHEASIDVRQWSRVPVEALDLGARGVVIELVAEGERAGGVAVEVESELALALVGALAARTPRAPGRLPRVAVSRRIDPQITGALAGVVLHIARALGGDTSLAGADAPSDETEARMARRGDGAIVVTARVRVGALESRIRLAASPSLFTGRENAKSPASSSPRALSSLGEMPLALRVVVAAGWGRGAELLLDVGDVVVIDGLLRGDECVLVGEGATFGIAAVLLREGARPRVRIEGALVELAPEPPTVEKPAPMTDSTDSVGTTRELPTLGDEGDARVDRGGGPLADVLAELPLLVRVEVGAVTLPAREWGSLGKGDVVVLDQRVGDAVTLRIGGRIVGKGELVDVEGAVGVRLLETVP